jgi:CAAX amino terminal protease family.
LMIFKVLVTGLVLAVSCVLIGKVIANFAPMGSYPYAYAASSPLQAMFVFWIFGSFTEEVVFRGLIQSYLSEHITGSFALLKWRITFPALIGTIFFSLAHIALLFQGANISMTVYIVLSAFVSGIASGYFRDKTGSLIGSFIVHMLFNVIGSIGGY